MGASTWSRSPTSGCARSFSGGSTGPRPRGAGRPTSGSSSTVATTGRWGSGCRRCSVLRGGSPSTSPTTTSALSRRRTPGSGGVDLDPEPGSAAARREEWIRSHPRQHAARRGLTAALGVIVPILLLWLWQRLDVPLPELVAAAHPVAGPARHPVARAAAHPVARACPDPVAGLVAPGAARLDGGRGEVRRTGRARRDARGRRGAPPAAAGRREGPRQRAGADGTRAEAGDDLRE